MGLADAAAKMRRDVQDFHSAATAGCGRLNPPGAGNVRVDRHQRLELRQQQRPMGIDVVGQAMAELAAIAADAVLPPAPFQMLEAKRVHPVGIPDLLHRLLAHVADHELAAPIQKAGADQAVGVHRIAVENVGAGVGAADVLLIDALGDFDAGVLLDVELRPAGREVLDKDAVAVVAERVEEFLALRLGDQLTRNFDRRFRIRPCWHEPFDVLDERLEVELEAGELRVGLLGHAVDRDVDLVDAGLHHRADAVGRESVPLVVVSMYSTCPDCLA